MDDRDALLLCGDITYGDLDKTKELFSRLKGNKYLIDFSNKKPFTRKEWQSIGVSHVFDVNGFINGEIDGKDSKVVIFAKDKNLRKILSEAYGAAPQSRTKQRNIYQDKILNLSIKEWGYAPILYEDIPRLVDNMVLFEKMENKEVNLNE